MVTSIQTRIEPRGYFPAASVDPTDARKQLWHRDKPSRQVKVNVAANP
jgi:hypothetical protein